MWDTTKEVIIHLVNSPILYVATILVLYILLKKGLISIDTGAVRIGKTRSNERMIISSQLQYVTLHCDAIAQRMIMDLPHIQPMHIKYVLCRIQDELVRRIACNHISLDSVYTNEVYLTLIDITRKRAGDPYFFSAEFEEFVRKEVNEILTNLLLIRSRLTKG